MNNESNQLTGEEIAKRTICDCPFCEGDIDGCCFCDHSGKIYVGAGYVFEKTEDMAPFQKEFVKETDLRRLWEQGAFNNNKSSTQNT
jgi:hypothetical protein